jgi:transcription elongation GreA/GreB family factor
VARPDKSEIAQALRARVEQELNTLRASQRTAQEGAIHEETRQEDPKDTRAIEAQYVSRGLADRVEDLHRTLTTLATMRLDTFGEDDPIDVSALVGFKDGDTERIYFLVPVAGGETLEVAGTRVQTLTPESPLGSALCGACTDHDVELDLPGRRLVTTIDWVL